MLYLIDTIGTETGMHLYDQSFVQTLNSKGLPVTVLSNYDTPQRQALFPNFYHGNKLWILIRFAWSLVIMLCFYLRHHGKDDVYVYQSFGLRVHDRLFIRMLCGCKRLYVIAHDIFEITGSGEDPRKDKKLKFYNEHIPAIICHSHDTECQLKALGYTGRTLYYPHFSYQFSKEIDQKKVALEVREAISPDHINFLFFGQIRETKGILILQQAIDLLAREHPEFGQRARIIIAGMDKGQLISNREQPSFVRTILRYMEDSELNYLFSQQPYVLLPYTEIYQSGVLEVVIYFRCPCILSDIPFFRQILDDYPSFGLRYSPNSPEALADVLLRTLHESTAQTFSSADIQRYNSTHDPTRLSLFLSSQC